MKVAIVSCFDVYDHRVELLQKFFHAEGHSVSVLIPNFRHLQRCPRAHCPEGFEMLPAAPYYGKFSAARIRSHIRFSRDALARARALRPDLLWVLAPPNSLVREAALYKRQRREMKLVLDFLDLWPESLPAPGFGITPFGRTWRGLRDRYVNTADTVVTESSQYWAVLGNHCGREKLHTLFAPRELSVRTLEGHPPGDKIALCLLGQVNHDIDFQAAGALFQRLDQPVEVHVIGDGDQEPLLRRTVEDAGGSVNFHGRVYAPEAKMRIFDRCHAGLNLLKSGPPSRLTMKSVDYLAASLPVINNVRGDIWDFIERHPVGLNYDGTARITALNLLALQSRREQIQAVYHTYFAERIFSMNLRRIVRE